MLVLFDIPQDRDGALNIFCAYKAQSCYNCGIRETYRKLHFVELASCTTSRDQASGAAHSLHSKFLQLISQSARGAYLLPEQLLQVLCVCFSCAHTYMHKFQPAASNRLYERNLLIMQSCFSRYSIKFKYI
jgi:hypothetical protein